MAKSNHDELADALARMASGDIAPSDALPPEPVPEPPPVKKPTLRTSPSPTPAAPRLPAAAPVERAPAPRHPAPARPAPAQTAPARQRTAAPTRPTAPIVPNLAPPEEPRTDAPPDTAAEVGDPSAIYDDDDSVIVPAPDAAVFAPRPKPVVTPKAHRMAVYQSVEFRRTIIPILLTCGVLLWGFASLKFIVSSDLPLSELPIWLPLMFFIIGAVLLGVAVMNMLSVQSSLSALVKDKQT